VRLWDPEHGAEVARIVTGQAITSLLAMAITTAADHRLVVGGHGGIACFAVGNAE
jgi:hypothetical protein